MNPRQIIIFFLFFFFVLTASCQRGAETRTTVPGAPVIVISIDTLRADHLPAYGYAGVATPAIDALRRDSILFQNAYAHAPLTLPSHVSLLTGLLPNTHKVRDNMGYRLDPAIVTIPSMLKPAGYESGGAVSSYVLRSSTGFARTFDFFDDGVVSRANVAVGALQRSGRDTSAIARQWIEPRKQRPFFFLLHLFEPHSPYSPPEPFRSRYPLAYDGEIAEADQIVGDFLESLKRNGIYDQALIVLLSDHGEGLGQHGEPEHGIFLYREAIHVPLLVKLPHAVRAGETVDGPVGLVDVLPTIAEITGTTAAANVEGRSLLRAAESTRRVYSETLYPRIHLGWSELRSLVDAEYHFIEAPRPELYHLPNDPAETRNVLAKTRRVYASMREQLTTHKLNLDLPRDVDPEEARKLAALGYLGSTAAPSSGPLPDPKDGMPEIAAMMQAMRFASANEHARAVIELRRIVAKNPLLSDAWTQLGQSLDALGRYEEAVTVYRKAIEMTPSLASEFGLRLAGVYLRLDRLDEAAQHARLGEKANYGVAHLTLARIEIERKQFSRAEEEARLALRDPHNDIQARVLIARIYGLQDRAPEALAMAEDARIAAQKRNVGEVESLHFVVGDALARMQQYDRAEQALRRETQLFPHNREAYSGLYIVYVLTNRLAEADAALEAMVRANPTKSAMLFAAESADTLGNSKTASNWRARAARAK